MGPGWLQSSLVGIVFLSRGSRWYYPHSAMTPRGQHVDPRSWRCLWVSGGCWSGDGGGERGGGQQGSRADARAIKGTRGMWRMRSICQTTPGVTILLPRYTVQPWRRLVKIRLVFDTACRPFRRKNTNVCFFLSYSDFFKHINSSFIMLFSVIYCIV